ncbi:TonB-dependent receptor [Erythrobacter ani]|uniref:TonB-dependent receptor n=1 Tax=Erythrobacter ani TaxID=2827235 RepID=A0ABS6SND9_9SPHN|nr:TonB-dependent receptor [Erythrobacter ani]MBV7266545.1 TonB-dependent receptor [Erythrobacter ani]
MRSISSGSAGSYRFTLLAGAAAFAVALPSAAFAQDNSVLADSDDADELTLEDEGSSNVIIVTASKREQTLQETPISVSVTSGETLEQAQIRDVLDLQTVAPSLRVSQLQTSSASTFIIRGFGNGDNNFGIEPSVGVFIDGVFRSRSASALNDLANVQRIEVLNGPQSTLFGKNASAGVISVVTRPPQFEFGGSVEAVYGNFNQVFLKGDITGPINDVIAFSVDGSYQNRDGFGEIINLNEEINDRNRYTVRGQLLIEPTPDLSVRLIGDYSEIDEVCCQTSNLIVGPSTADAITAVGGQFPSDFFSFDNFLNVAPVNENENYGISAQIDWSSGPISVTSITAYRELRNFFNQDIDFTSADLSVETRDQAVDTFTQELRIASDFDGPINFLLGAYYFDESIEQNSSLTIGEDFRDFAAFSAASGAAFAAQPLLIGSQIPGITAAQQIAAGEAALQAAEAGAGFPIGSILGGDLLSSELFALDNESYSIFGTVDFEPFDGFVITAGFNYTDDQKDFIINTVAPDPLANVNVVDAFITAATMGAVTSRDAFLTLPAAQQQGLAAAALDPATNPFLGLSALQFQTGFLDVPNVVEPGETNDDEFTYLFRAAYQVSNEVNVYASYATGFKASSVNLSRDSRPTPADFTPGPGPSAARGSTFLAPSSPITDAGIATPNLSTGSRFAAPEEAEVYEIGLKAQWEGVGINLALFDQTIENFQSFVFTGLGFTLLNAGQQSVRGFELDTTINPVDGLVLTFAATHLDPVFDSFPNSVLGDLSGARPGGIPSWSIATSATYTHEWASGTRLINRIDYNHESNTDINNGLPTFNFARGGTEIFRREVNLVNASVTLALNNGLEVGAFARNLLDDEYILTVFDGVAQGGTVSGYPNAPRTYGGVVRFKF